MVEGLRRAGRNLTRENFVRAMESIQDYDVGGFKVSYGPGNRSGSISLPTQQRHLKGRDYD